MSFATLLVDRHKFLQFGSTEDLSSTASTQICSQTQGRKNQVLVLASDYLPELKDSKDKGNPTSRESAS